MPGKKTSQQPSIKVGNISGVNREVNIAGGNITTNKTNIGLSAVEIQQLFDQLYSAIEAHAETSPTSKESLKDEVGKIQSRITRAVKKNEKVDEGFLSKRFRNIARMAPDILDVMVASLGNPLAGLGIAVRKIAEKAKAEVSQERER